MQKPSVGRVVHFYSAAIAGKDGYGRNGVGKGPYAAIVTQVFTDTNGEVTFCNMKVFPPFANAWDEGSVSEGSGPDDASGRFWIWPPRV